jgi:HupE / UreJ protein
VQVLGRRIAMAGLLAALLAPSLSAPVRAHHIRRTALYVDFGSRSVALEIRMPLEELSFARGKLVKLTDWQVDPVDARELADYLRAHLKVQRAGETLALSIASVAVETENLLVMHAVARASQPEALRAIDLRYDAITERVNTHETYVFVRRDLDAGQLGEAPKLYSTLHWQHRTVHIERAPGGWTQGFAAVFKLGVVHIAEGTDHLLFLLMLLLPAPLLARGRRWVEPRSVMQSLRATFWIVTAFTFGHSLTLIAAAVRGLALPVQPVEVVIALSILVSASHALRPLFAGREPLIAAGFGLVHGLAFARELLGFGFDGRSLALALFGFNLGIEAMQLAVVLGVLPVLLFASRSPRYAWLRIAGAACGAIASAGWIAERAFGISARIPALGALLQ